MKDLQIDHKVLVEARRTLSEAAVRAQNASLEARDNVEAYRLAYTRVYLEAAEVAIFSALNVLDAYLNDEEAGRVKHLGKWEPRPKTSAEKFADSVARL